MKTFLVTLIMLSLILLVNYSSRDHYVEEVESGIIQKAKGRQGVSGLVLSPDGSSTSVSSIKKSQHQHSSQRESDSLGFEKPRLEIHSLKMDARDIRMNWQEGLSELLDHELDLSGPEKKRFQKIVAERKQKELERGLNLVEIDPLVYEKLGFFHGVTKEERKWLDKIQADYEKNLLLLLGNQKYAKYHQFRDQFGQEILQDYENPHALRE